MISDTHQQHDNLTLLLDGDSRFDLCIHLGDSETGEEEMAKLLPCPVVMVAGNNDFFGSMPLEKVIILEGYSIFLCHGHFHRVYLGTKWLKLEAKKRNCQVAMYGHTHIPYLEETKDLTILCPGSLSYPRQEDRLPSYLVMEIDEQGKVNYQQCYLQ
ncbi:phosphoesterase [Clostridia bacterium]|nr:phosphoesterase [Clostridia bacterium]